MSQVSGIIQNIESRKVSNGTKTAYDVYVGGQKYGAGLWAPKAQIGDYVTFDANQSQYGFDIARGTLKVGKAPPAEVQAAQTKTVVKQAVNSFDARQDAISRQAASNTAIAWVTFLNSAGALATTAKNKGDLQARLDILRREYEKEFFEANTGNVYTDISPNKKDVEQDDAADDEEESGAEEAWS